jgi:hypothetical protein
MSVEDPSCPGLDGGYVVTWTNDAADAVAQRYRQDGSAAGAPVLVNAGLGAERIAGRVVALGVDVGRGSVLSRTCPGGDIGRHLAERRTQRIRSRLLRATLRRSRRQARRRDPHVPGRRGPGCRADCRPRRSAGRRCRSRIRPVPDLPLGGATDATDPQPASSRNATTQPAPSSAARPASPQRTRAAAALTTKCVDILTPDSTGKTLDEAASAAGLGTTEDSAWLILHQPQRECFLRNSLSFCIL